MRPVDSVIRSALAKAADFARAEVEDLPDRLIVGIISRGGERDRLGDIFRFEPSLPVVARWAEDVASERIRVPILKGHGGVEVGDVLRVLIDGPTQTVSVIARLDDAELWRTCEKRWSGISRGSISSRYDDDRIGKIYAWTKPPTEVSFTGWPVIPSAYFRKIEEVRALRKRAPAERVDVSRIAQDVTDELLASILNPGQLIRMRHVPRRSIF